MSDFEKIITDLSSLTVLEMAKLCEALEQTWGVSAAAPVAVASAVANDSSAAANVEKVEFDVLLSSVGESKIQVIKAVRGVTSLGLKEAKALVDGVGEAAQCLKSSIPKEEADSIKEIFETLGAKVELK